MFRTSVHIFRTTGVALLAALATASAASATPPTRENLGTFTYDFMVDCGSFDNQVRGTASIVRRTFYDASGKPIKVVVHDSFRETDTNSRTGRSLRFTGSHVESFDLVADTRTVVGKSFLMTSPGHGVVIQDAGRVVFDAPYHVAFEAGHHQVLHGDVDALACSALA